MSRMLRALLVASVLAALVASTPEWNFDCIGYAGVARLWLGQSAEAAHAAVYRDLQLAAPAEKAHEIATGSQYRAGLSRDWRAFSTQLPFYANKPLYVALIAAATHFGANGMRAAFAVSALAAGVLMAVLWLWLERVVEARVAGGVAAGLVLSTALLEVGRLATPDALGAALCLAGLFALLELDHPRLGGSLLIAAVAARPDNAMLIAAVLVGLMYAHPGRRVQALALLVPSVLTGVAVSLCSGAYAWGVLFNHTFVRRVLTAADLTAASTVAPAAYARALGRGLTGKYVLHPPLFWLFALLSIATALLARRPGEALDREQLALPAAVWLAASAHFLLFPMLADRFFVVHCLLASIWAAKLLGRAPARAPQAS